MNAAHGREWRAGIALTLMVLVPAVLHAQQPETLRGTVRSDSGRAVAGATVITTRSTDRAVTQATSDAEGRWQMTIAEGSGDYLVFVSAAGFQSARRRVQRQGSEREFVADFTLATIAPQQLRAISVQAGPPPRPGRGAAPLGTEETGASEKWVEGVAGSLSPAQRGDLGALAGTIAGLTTGPGGASLLGADASSNLNTLNGAAIPGGTLPRAAQVDARFVGATFDPTRGGFAGGQFELQLRAGDRLFQQRRAFLTLDPSLLQRTDAIGRAQGLNGQSIRASLGADGELTRKSSSYNVALDYARRASEPATLLSADVRTLNRAGVNPDSVQRLRTIAAGLALPLGLRGAQQLSETISWLGRLDDTRDTSRVLALMNFVTWERESGLGADARTSPSALRERRSLSGSLQLLHQHYLGARKTVYNENRLGFSRTARSGAPALLVPSVAVVVGGVDLEGGDDVALLSAAGARGAVRDESSWTTEGASEWAWLARGTKHRFRATAWVRGDGASTLAPINALGTFQFNSLADLAANQPAYYTRTLSDQVRTGDAWNGAVAMAHRWAPSRRFQALYGVRVEGGMFTTTPARNATVEQAFGIRTDEAPARVVVSPRAGFTWRPLPNRPVSTGITKSEMGTFLQPSTNIIRGGMGVFRDLYRPTTVANAAAATGLPGSAISIFCVGASAPRPTWNAYDNESAIPSSCLDASPLSQQATPVLALAPGFDVPRSWRATLNWSGAYRLLLLRAEAVGARNLGSPGTINHNFTNQPVFSLGTDGRPVFVPVTSIDPATGAVSSAASRRNPAFGSVRTLQSDLESRGAQVTFNVTPDPLRMNGRFTNVSYTLQTVRQQYRGFDGGSRGDPGVVEWARAASDARHSVLFQLGTSVPKVGLFTLFVRLQSGRPFTPIVQGDIDGDGTAGDRAFVFIPSSARPADAALYAGMDALLRGASPTIRRCLERQGGTIAARQSCEGPWTQSMNARLDVRIPNRLLGRRTSLSLNFSNPLSGLDQLLHGENLRGWGNSAEPDPVLLVPRAFDAATRTFQYRVNPRFGDTRPSRTLFRTPFRVSLDFSWDLSRDEAAQNLDRSLDPVKENGAWRRPPASAIAQRYRARISSVHSVILFNSDTLFLTRSQVEAFSAADTAFRRGADSIYFALADSLSALPERFNASAAIDMIKRADDRYEALFWAQRDVVKAQLTPIQSSALPEFIARMITEKLDDDPARRPRYRFTNDGSSVRVSRN